MKIFLLVFLYLIPSLALSANCQLLEFRWQCNIQIQKKPTKNAHSFVYCENYCGYVTTAEFDQLVRYQRRNIHIVEEYSASPCIPVSR